MDIAINKTTFEPTGNEIFSLNISDKAKLKNGFRYIKELLLQHHNYKMDSDYRKLIKNGIEVFSVKTDAFTIHHQSLSLVHEL